MVNNNVVAFPRVCVRDEDDAAIELMRAQTEAIRAATRIANATFAWSCVKKAMFWGCALWLLHSLVTPAGASAVEIPKQLRGMWCGEYGVGEELGQRYFEVPMDQDKGKCVAGWEVNMTVTASGYKLKGFDGGLTENCQLTRLRTFRGEEYTTMHDMTFRCYRHSGDGGGWYTLHEHWAQPRGWKIRTWER
jgi:hypothetical protein